MFFVIATGRSYFDYKKKKDLYNISCDYLIINHGATILKNDDIIFNIPIDNDIKIELKKDLKLDLALDSFFCSRIDSRVNFNCVDLTKIHVKYQTSEIAKAINELINSKYSNKISSFLVCKDSAIEIVANAVNKSIAIQYIADLEKISKNSIYTIGDSYSDVEMIKNFNGFAMVNSIKQLKEITGKQYSSVSDLILEVMSESNE